MLELQGSKPCAVPLTGLFPPELHWLLLWPKSQHCLPACLMLGDRLWLPLRLGGDLTLPVAGDCFPAGCRAALGV